MTDRHGIGRKMEVEAMTWLQGKGYHHFWQPPRAKYRKMEAGGTDIWGWGDFLCIGMFGAFVVVQCCRDRRDEIDERQRKIYAWCAEAKPSAVFHMVVAYKKNKSGTHWRIV